MQLKTSPVNIRWDFEPNEVIQIAQQAIEKHQKAQKAIFENKEPRTFENTIIPLTLSEYEYEAVTSPLTFLRSVSPKKELRDALGEAENLIDDYNHQSNSND